MKNLEKNIENIIGIAVDAVIETFNQRLEGMEIEQKCPMCLDESPTCAYCNDTGKIKIKRRDLIDEKS